MHPARSGDRNIVGGDRHLPDRGIGFKRRGDRYTTDRWNVAVDTGPGPGPPPFDPTTIAGLKGWWKADSITASLMLRGWREFGLKDQFPEGVDSQSLDPKSAPPDGTGIAFFPDSSGNGNNANFWSLAATFYSNMLNGKPAVHWNGPGCQYTLTKPFVTTLGWTIFSVLKPDAMGGDISSISNSGIDAHAGPLNNTGFYYLGHGGWYHTNKLANLNWHVISGSTVPEIYVDGIKVSGADTAGTVGQPFDVMGVRAPGIWAVGYIAEILAYEGILSAADIDKVNDYLLGKYGITKALPEPPLVAIGGTLLAISADSLSLTGGAPVTVLNDQSDSQNHLSQSGAACPTFLENAINGKPAIHFDSTIGQFMNLTAPMAPTFNYTIIVVSRRPVGKSLDTINSPDYSASFYLRFNASDNVIYSGVSDTTVMHSGAFKLLDEAFHVHTWLMNETKFFVDGVMRSEVWGGSGGTQGPHNHLGSIGSDGDIAEIVVYNRILSDADRIKAEEYLFAKYAIPFDPRRITGLRAWWAADQITAGSLLRGAVKKELVKTVLMGGLITPIPIDPDSRAAPADGAGVSVWMDTSGNGCNLSNTYGGPPLFKANIVNGKPVVRFLADAFHVMDGSGTPIALSQPSTIIMVAKKPNAATYGVLIDSSTNPATAQNLTIIDNSGHFAIGAGAVIIDSANHQGAFHIFTGIFNGANSSAFVDGTLAASGNAGTQTLDNVRLQSTASGTILSEYDLAECLIYTHALSDPERNQVEAYLKAKYAIP